MNHLFFSTLLLISSALTAQVCTITDSLYNVIDGQAKQILLNEMVANRTATENPVEFDPVRLTEYIALLYAVHELDNSPDRNTVIDQLNIQPFSEVSPHIVRVATDPDQDWMVNLRNELPSGNNKLDSLMAEYDLEVSRFLLLSSFHVVDLITPRFLNTPALAEVFETTMDSLNFAESKPIVGDGDRIEMIPLFPEGHIVRYSVGSGDCPAGCTMRENYDFNVEPECTEFDIQESGSTATRRTLIAPLTVFPVPFSGELHLPETISRYDYTLFDALGRIVSATSTGRSGPIIGLESLPSGWYTLRVKDLSGRVYATRILK